MEGTDADIARNRILDGWRLHSEPPHWPVDYYIRDPVRDSNGAADSSINLVLLRTIRSAS